VKIRLKKDYKFYKNQIGELYVFGAGVELDVDFIVTPEGHHRETKSFQAHVSNNPETYIPLLDENFEIIEGGMVKIYGHPFHNFKVSAFFVKEK